MQKKRNIIMNKGKGFSLVGMLMAIVIIVVLYYVAMKFYSPKKVFNKETQKSLAKEGLNINSYKELVDTVKDKVEEVNKKIDARDKEIKKLLKSGK